MADRYTVARNMFGYEMHSGALRYAVIDNQPEHMSTYSPIERGRILKPLAEVSAALLSNARFRQIAFAMHKEDAEAIAAAMNAASAKTLAPNAGAFACALCGVEVTKSSHAGPICLMCRPRYSRP